jgi:hypothetical protein
MMQDISAAPPRAAEPAFKTPPPGSARPSLSSSKQQVHRARSFDAGMSRAGAPLVSLPTTPASLLHRDFRPHSNTPIAKTKARARSLTAPALTEVSTQPIAVPAPPPPPPPPAAAAPAVAADQLEDSGIATASELGEFVYGVGPSSSLKETSSYSSFDDVSLLQLESSEASVPRGFGERIAEVRRYDDSSSEDRQHEVCCDIAMLHTRFNFI